MKKLLRLLAGSLALLIGTTACMDVEYGLVLERDLSGTATMDLEIDLERMATTSARIQKMFSGEEGEPTEEELAAAREEMLAQLEDQDELSEEGLRDEIESDLPEGVALLEVEADDEGLQRRVRLRFAFDHVDRLRNVDMGPDDEEAGEEGVAEEDAGVEAGGADAGDEAGGADASDEGAEANVEPFGDLEVIDEGETLLVTNAPFNPLAEIEQQMDGGMSGMEGIVLQAFEGLRVAFSLRAPWEVVEHNATRVDGNTLWWEFDFASLAQGEDEVPGHIMVRYRK